MNYIIFGQRIRHFRLEKGMTQEQLAEAVELSASFLGHIERGSRIPSLDTMMKVCAALEVTPNDLLENDLGAAGQELPKHITIVPAELLHGIALLLRKENP